MAHGIKNTIILNKLTHLWWIERCHFSDGICVSQRLMVNSTLFVAVSPCQQQGNHQSSVLLAFYEGNPPATVEFPKQKSVTQKTFQCHGVSWYPPKASQLRAFTWWMSLMACRSIPRHYSLRSPYGYSWVNDEMQCLCCHLWPSWQRHPAPWNSAMPSGLGLHFLM